MRHTHSHTHSLSCLVALGTQNGFTTNDNNVSDMKVSISISNSLFLSYSNFPLPAPVAFLLQEMLPQHCKTHFKCSAHQNQQHNSLSISLSLSHPSCCSSTFSSSSASSSCLSFQ